MAKIKIIANTGPISDSPSLLRLYYRFVTNIFQEKSLSLSIFTFFFKLS